MGKVSSSSIKHTYTFYANGTFVAQDDRGNSFAVKRLQGLPSGTVVTALRANSTVAIQNYLLILGSQTAANISVFYSIRHQFCQPAGLKITISGRSNWGSRGSGMISLPFNKSPISIASGRAWFGNKSSVRLGFDWTDSLSMNPSFEGKSQTLTYSVGADFVIDPVTAATSDSQFATLESHNMKACYSNGRYWLWFTQTSPSGLWWVSSSDGASWSSATRATWIAGSGMVHYAIWCDGTTVYYQADDPTTRKLWWRYGTLNGDGTISWSIDDTQDGGPAGVNILGPTIAVNSTGGIFWTDMSIYGVYAKKSATSGSWYYIGLPSCLNYDNVLVPLTSGKMGLVCGSWNTTPLYATTWSGSGLGILMPEHLASPLWETRCTCQPVLLATQEGLVRSISCHFLLALGRLPRRLTVACRPLR